MKDVNCNSGYGSFFSPLPRLLIVVLFFCASSAHAEDLPKFMTHIEYAYKTPSTSQYAFTPKPLNLWRAGTAFLTIVEAPDYANLTYGKLITHEPDSWAVNLVTKSAKHVLDTEASQLVHAPIFPWKENKEIRNLEFGRELSFFLEQKAKATEGEKLRGVKSQQYELVFGSAKLILLVDPKTKVPLRAQLRDGEQEFVIDYLTYEDHLTFDPSVFALPPGISVEEAKSERPRPQESKDDTGAWLGPYMTYYYLHPDPSRIAESLKVVNDQGLLKNFLSMSGFYAPIMRQNPDMLPGWIQAAKEQGADMRQFMYFSLRECGSERCLSELRKNPYDFDDEGVKHFAEVKPQSVDSIPLASPEVLDFLWTNFLATGSDVGPRRIAKLVGEKWPLFESKELHAEELLIVGAAHWSLVSNAEQHKKVLSILKEESEHIPALKKVLEEVRSTEQKQSH